jgi:hypothetical protein|tara:strand:- start:6134 stop:6382 length:249 start_codon:yes stop_codon:yes gene_type:complete
MGKMKDKKVEKDINKVIKLTEEVNDICKGLKKENVTIRFEINHSMSDEDTISVANATQRVDYNYMSDEPKTRTFLSGKSSDD